MSHLTQEQRYTISVLKKEGFSQKEIADKTDRHKSVICRELRRNCDLRNGEYKAELAQKKYETRQKEKPKRVYFTKSIRLHVESKIRQDYSPEQIVGECKLLGIRCVSIERIYQHIWQDKSVGGDLYTHLRNQGRKYRKRGSEKDKRVGPPMRYFSRESGH